MKKGLPTLFGLLVLFIVLAVMIVLQEPTPSSPIQPTDLPPRTPQAFEQTYVYQDLDGNAIQAIRLLDPHSEQSVTFARNPINLWTAPYLEDVTLDQTAMRQIELTLVILPYAHRFIPQAERLTEYGFLPDGKHYFSVLFVMDDGTTHALAVGNPTDFGGRAVYYVIVDDYEEVYLVYREPIDFLAQKFLKPPIIS